MKLYYPDSSVTARQNFFSVPVVQLWNKLPEEVVSDVRHVTFDFYIASINPMHVSFCFSAVCFFINVSFRAVVSAL